ncbi:MAG: hypothetical protein ACPHQA_03565 [Candidatus Puniceispirillaceae bacterium]
MKIYINSYALLGLAGDVWASAAHAQTHGEGFAAVKSFILIHIFNMPRTAPGNQELLQ